MFHLDFLHWKESEKKKPTKNDVMVFLDQIQDAKCPADETFSRVFDMSSQTNHLKTRTRKQNRENLWHSRLIFQTSVKYDFLCSDVNSCC